MTTRREFLAQTAGTGLMLGLSGGALTWTPVCASAADQAADAAPDPFAWFADSPFNLLVDYYTEVPFRPYGSGATRENVVRMLRDLQPGYIIIYAKGHSGRTTFPSSLKTEHEMLAKDVPAFFREVTRETGTKLFFYYSGLLDGIAGTRHPEWAQPDGDKPRRYFAEFADLFTAIAMCPRSRYWDDWVAVHVRELLTRYDPDGLWVDGDWAGPCTCERCRPDPWSTVTDEWRQKFRALIKSLKPSCMYSAGNVGARREFGQAFDWRSGDWFSPNNHRLHASIAMRRYTNLGVPYDAFTCDTVFVHSRPQIRAAPRRCRGCCRKARPCWPTAASGATGRIRCPTARLCRRRPASRPPPASSRGTAATSACTPAVPAGPRCWTPSRAPGCSDRA